MMMNSKFKALAPIAISIAVMVSLMAIVLGQASIAAARGVPTIDTTRGGSLTIHKSEGDPFTQYGDPHRGGQGHELEPIEGVRFQIQRIDGLDLTTSTGWQDATKLKVEDFYAGGSEFGRLGSPREALTDASGNAHFDIPAGELGFYYVTEVPGPAQDKSLSVINPFIVSVPRTELAGRSSWEYDITVNAKDQRLGINKAANRARATVGDEVRFTTSATVPAPQSDGRIYRYEIIDPLVNELDYIGNPEVTLTDGHGKKELLPSDDYTVSTHNARVVRMQLTSSGLEKLAAMRDGNPGTQVTFSFAAKVNVRPDGGIIPNTSYLLTSGYPDFDQDKPDKGVPSNKVTVKVPEESPSTTATASRSNSSSTSSTIAGL